MRTIFVLRAFNLLLNDSERERSGAESNMVSFKPGRYDVHEIIAEHSGAKPFLGDEDRYTQSVSALPGAAPVGDVVPRAELQAAETRITDLTRALEAAQAGSAGQTSMIDNLRRDARAARDARDEAVRERDEARKALDEANESVRALTANLGAASKGRAPGIDPAAAGAGGSTSSAEIIAAAGLEVRHRGGGKYAVFRGEEQLSEAMTKGEATEVAEDLATKPPEA